MRRIAFTTLAIALASTSVANADSGKTIAPAAAVRVTGIVGDLDGAKKMMGGPKIGEGRISLPTNISGLRSGIVRVR
jgi:hypothetical protein